MDEVYCSIDVETDGSNPLQHSMRSIGVAAFTDTKGLISTFYCTIQPRPNTSVDPVTMEEFWNKYPDHWREVNTNATTPQIAMLQLSNWLSSFTSSNICVKWVARPANFDWMWLKCYYEAYGPINRPPIGFFCHDLSALVLCYIKCHGITDRKAFEDSLTGGRPYTHHALDDAICQGEMYTRLRRLLADHWSRPCTCHLPSTTMQTS